MKYVCLGFVEEASWASIPAEERRDLLGRCTSYDDQLRGDGHYLGGEALQSVRTATTLRHRQGQLSITDGPFAETKEQLGGVIILEARDLDEAIRLMAKHPSIGHGASWEIRPTTDLVNIYGSGAPDHADSR